MWLLDKFLNKAIKIGRLIVTDHDGKSYEYGPGPEGMDNGPMRIRLTNRKAAAHLSAYQVAGWENLIVVLATLPFSLGEFGGLAATDWLWLALLGIFCTALSHILLVSSLVVLNARSAGIVIALEPVYAIAFAAALFAQYPGVRALIGGAIMIGAIVWSGLRSAEHSPRKAQ